MLPVRAVVVGAARGAMEAAVLFSLRAPADSVATDVLEVAPELALEVVRAAQITAAGAGAVVAGEALATVVVVAAVLAGAVAAVLAATVAVGTAVVLGDAAPLALFEAGIALADPADAVRVSTTRRARLSAAAAGTVAVTRAAGVARATAGAAVGCTPADPALALLIRLATGDALAIPAAFAFAAVVVDAALVLGDTGGVTLFRATDALAPASLALATAAAPAALATALAELDAAGGRLVQTELAEDGGQRRAHQPYGQSPPEGEDARLLVKKSN
jgi:hypothetical protein